MMTTQEIILEMEKLLPEERQVVFQHFEREDEEKYSKEVIAELLERKKDAEKGINMTDFFSGEDITAPLKELMQS